MFLIFEEKKESN